MGFPCCSGGYSLALETQTQKETEQVAVKQSQHLDCNKTQEAEKTGYVQSKNIQPAAKVRTFSSNLVEQNLPPMRCTYRMHICVPAVTPSTGRYVWGQRPKIEDGEVGQHLAAARLFSGLLAHSLRSTSKSYTSVE